MGGDNDLFAVVDPQVKLAGQPRLKRFETSTRSLELDSALNKQCGGRANVGTAKPLTSCCIPAYPISCACAAE